MDEEEVFPADELKSDVDQFVRMLSETAPHRPDEIKLKGRVVSPMP